MGDARAITDEDVRRLAEAAGMDVPPEDLSALVVGLEQHRRRMTVLRAAEPGAEIPAVVFWAGADE